MIEFFVFILKIYIYLIYYINNGSNNNNSNNNIILSSLLLITLYIAIRQQFTSLEIVFIAYVYCNCYFITQMLTMLTEVKK